MITPAELRPLCECGCGQATSQIKKTNNAKGYVAGQYHRFLSGHKRRIEVMDVAPRFFARVDKTPTCWMWTGAKNSYGYGRLAIGGVMVGAHRWSYEHHVGPIPEGLVIDHLCRVRHCVNPDHLEPVTNAENISRGDGAKRTHCPSGHELDDANTIMKPDKPGKSPYRACLICKRDQTKRSAARRRQRLRAEDLLANLRATTQADAARALAEAIRRTP